MRPLLPRPSKRWIVVVASVVMTTGVFYTETSTVVSERPSLAAAPAGVRSLRTASPTSELSGSDWSGIRAAYERHRHQVVPAATEPGVWRARTPGQQWTTRFDERGFLVAPDEGGWTWGLTLMRYGIQGAAPSVVSTASVSVENQRVTYRWDARVDEWIVNGGRGLEHGFTLRERPAGGVGSLTIELGMRGELRPRAEADRRGITFVNAQDAAVVTYRGLTVVDADGVVLPATLETAGAGVRVVVDDRGAQYPITIDPVAQQAYLKASNTGLLDAFGLSVAISGDTVVVGTRFEDSNATGVNGDQANNGAADSGAAYVFVRTAGVWSQQAYLKASNTGAGDSFGLSVAVSGDTVVVGAFGEDSNATGVNGDQSDNSASTSGAAYVFVRTAGVWSQQAYLKASNTGAGDSFGLSVAVSGDTVVVGAFGEDSNATGVNGNQTNGNALNAGAAYVFVRTAGVWSQQAYLKASNTGAGDQFGESVAVSGDTVVVGASLEDSNATGVDGDQANNSAADSGAAYVFARTAGVWSQQAYLKASNTGAGDQFGFGGVLSNIGRAHGVAVSGDTVVVGALFEDSNATGVNGDQSNNSASAAGAAYVFARTAGVWSQQAYLKASNTDASDGFGYSVGVSGDTVVVGAAFEDSNATGVDGDQANNSASTSGAAYVFVRTAGVWSQHAYLKASNTGGDDRFGHSVGVSGDTVVVGAFSEDSSATGVGGDQTDDLAAASGSGAAYVFTIETSPEESLTESGEDLQEIIGTHPGTPLADKVEDALVKVETALQELAKTPADKQAAMGNLEGAVGELQAALGLDPAQDGILTALMDLLAGIARQLAAEAFEQAIAHDSGHPNIAEAQQALENGDSLRSIGAFKDAVNKYKDALAKAESVLR